MRPWYLGAQEGIGRLSPLFSETPEKDGLDTAESDTGPDLLKWLGEAEPNCGVSQVAAEGAPKGAESEFLLPGDAPRLRLLPAQEPPGLPVQTLVFHSPWEERFLESQTPEPGNALLSYWTLSLGKEQVLPPPESSNCNSKRALRSAKETTDGSEALTPNPSRDKGGEHKDGQAGPDSPCRTGEHPA